MDISKNIATGVYEMQFPGPSRGMYLNLYDYFEACLKYDNLKEKLKKKFASDLHKEYGMTASQAKKAFIFACGLGYPNLKNTHLNYLRIVEIVGAKKEK
jgi:hypothetical protein